MSAKPLTVVLDSGDSVSALWQAPKDARAVLALAHGAGAGLMHKSMTAIAGGLAARGIATLRFNFLYMERGSKRVDSPTTAHAAIRAAVAEAARLAPKLPLFAGGKSFGGRMTSQAQALMPLPKVRGLVFFGFPLHPAGKPSLDRAGHLADVKLPMLFLEGSRDALAELPLLKKVVTGLRPRATLAVFDDADHSFHVPAKSGRTDTQVMDEIADTARDWILKHAR